MTPLPESLRKLRAENEKLKEELSECISEHDTNVMILKEFQKLFVEAEKKIKWYEDQRNEKELK